MNNPYEAPKADLTFGARLTQAGRNIPQLYRRDLCIAWAILSAIGLSQLPQLMALEPAVAMTSLVSSLFQNAVAVLAVFYLRGMETQASAPPHEVTVLSWFGLTWRAFVAQLLALLPMAAIAFLLLEPTAQYTVPRLLFATLIQTFSLLLVVWAVFSSDRTGQLRWLLSLARGW